MFEWTFFSSANFHRKVMKFIDCLLFLWQVCLMNMPAFRLSYDASFLDCIGISQCSVLPRPYLDLTLPSKLAKAFLPDESGRELFYSPCDLLILLFLEQFAWQALRFSVIMGNTVIFLLNRQFYLLSCNSICAFGRKIIIINFNLLISCSHHRHGRLVWRTLLPRNGYGLWWITSELWLVTWYGTWSVWRKVLWLWIFSF